MWLLRTPLLAAVILAASSPVALAMGAPYCQAGEVPTFHFGFAQLNARLGLGMGSPLECEHIDSSSDTVQHTTSGFAYYLKDDNLPVFAAPWLDSFQNWALAPNGVTFWQGKQDRPPPDAPVVSTDICKVSGGMAVGDPVRSACVYLYARQLGDPFASPAPNFLPSPPEVQVPSPAAPAGDVVVDTHIDGEFTGWDGETVFRLQNGQIWQQASYAYMYSYAYSPRVLIYQSAGGWRMQVDGVIDTIQVQRLR